MYRPVEGKLEGASVERSRKLSELHGLQDSEVYNSRYSLLRRHLIRIVSLFQADNLPSLIEMKGKQIFGLYVPSQVAKGIIWG